MAFVHCRCACPLFARRPSPHGRTAVIRLACGALTVVLSGPLAHAQQQTGYVLTSSQGRSVVSGSRSLAQSATLSLDGAELLLPLQLPIPPFGGNVRRIVRPDGSVAFEILDLDRPFGSFSGSVAREREETSGTRSFSNFSSLGYSVFQQ